LFVECGGFCKITARNSNPPPPPPHKKNKKTKNIFLKKNLRKKKLKNPNRGFRKSETDL